MPFAARLARVVLQMLGILVAGVCILGAPRAQTAADADAVDPPGRVGSVTLLAGQVTMVDLSNGSREDALLNWPVTGGWRIETGLTGRAEVRIGSTALRLDEQTTVDFARLDDELIQIAVLRGSVALRLRNPQIVNELEVLTQRERFSFDEPGSYRIDVDRPPGMTAVTAFAGRVRMASAGSSFIVATGQRGEVSAPPMLSFRLFAATADGFDDWVAGRDAREDAIRSAAYVSRETTGVEILDDYGDWRTVEAYGPVWFPRAMPATWAPYRYGRWVWISPWGWTWIDEAPWGFAPLHYGRWVVVGGTWGWIPGVVVTWPVYAPALVAWFGAPGVSVSIGGPIGWFPLGPHEVYVPAYRHTPRHFRVVNVQHVRHGDQITVVQPPKYVHRHPDRSTWVAGDRFGQPEPVRGANTSRVRSRRPMCRTPNGDRPSSSWHRFLARPLRRRRSIRDQESASRPGHRDPALCPAGRRFREPPRCRGRGPHRSRLQSIRYPRPRAANRLRRLGMAEERHRARRRPRRSRRRDCTRPTLGGRGRAWPHRRQFRRRLRRSPPPRASAATPAWRRATAVALLRADPRRRTP